MGFAIAVVHSPARPAHHAVLEGPRAGVPTKQNEATSGLPEVQLRGDRGDTAVGAFDERSNQPREARERRGGPLVRSQGKGKGGTRLAYYNVAALFTRRGTMPEFCPGYVKRPFVELAANYPGTEAYPLADFRVEWGPIFHRGRLDGTARVIVIGQDPGQHENIVRRILVGEAGRRVQGFLGKLGITRRYALINALLYSVYGSNGAKYLTKAPVRDYRDAWLQALLTPGKVEAVVTFGGMAKKAWAEYAKRNDVSSLHVAHLIHPTFPESAGGTAVEKRANTKKMLKEWNSALEPLRAAIKHKDDASSRFVPYGEAFADGDRVDIPSFDLPAGIPGWMYDDDGWARRVGGTLDEKRRNITITVPAAALS